MSEDKHTISMNKEGAVKDTAPSSTVKEESKKVVKRKRKKKEAVYVNVVKVNGRLAGVQGDTVIVDNGKKVEVKKVTEEEIEMLRARGSHKIADIADEYK